MGPQEKNCFNKISMLWLKTQKPSLKIKYFPPKSYLFEPA